MIYIRLFLANRLAVTVVILWSALLLVLPPVTIIIWWSIAIYGFVIALIYSSSVFYRRSSVRIRRHRGHFKTPQPFCEPCKSAGYRVAYEDFVRSQ